MLTSLLRQIYVAFRRHNDVIIASCSHSEVVDVMIIFSLRHRWIPVTKRQQGGTLAFSLCKPEQTVEQTIQ